MQHEYSRGSAYPNTGAHCQQPAGDENVPRPPATLGHEVRPSAPAQPSGNAEGRSWQELAHHYGLQHPFSIDWLPANPRFKRYDYAARGVGWARRQHADILYTRLPQAAALASLLGHRTILEIHDMPAGRAGPWLFRRFEREAEQAGWW